MKKYKGDFNSPINQRIKEKLVNIHIINGLNQTIEAIEEMEQSDLLENMSNFTPSQEEGYEEQYPEILEYWAVSSYLADKLEEKGECIAKDFLDFNVWGRTCSGQAILLDYVISDIAYDMEILEGQANEWKN